MTSKVLHIGYVAAVHGIRGEVLVRLHAAGSDVMAQVATVDLRRKDGATRTYVIEATRPHRDGWLTAFAEVLDRDGAEALRGAEVLVDSAALPPLEEDEFYLDTIMGFDVVDANAGPLGTIRGIMTTTIDILVVANADGQEVLVPLLDGVIEEVDDEARLVRVDVPEGLLD